jgi:transposase
MKRSKRRSASAPSAPSAPGAPGAAQRAPRPAHGPHLSDHDLAQMDDAWQQHQSDATVRGLLGRALDDLRRARDRLNQTPDNSSRPSGSMPPWQRGSAAVGTTVGTTVDDRVLDDALGDDEPNVPNAGEPDHEAQRQERPPGDATQHPDTAPSPSPSQAQARSDAPASDVGGCEPARDAAQCVTAAPLHAQQDNTAAKLPARPGRRVGAPGFGRQQKLAPTCNQEHHPACCAACLLALPTGGLAKAWTAWDTLELVALSPSDQLAPAGPAGPAAPVVLGARIEVTRHLLMQQRCACGHTTRARATRADDDLLWPGVTISQQRLLGPRLAATVVYLCLRMRLPRRKVSELMLELFGLQISAALIDQTVHQAARSVAPLEDQLALQLEQAVLVNADETSWSEAGLALWLWVLCSAHTVLYLIGSRAKEMFDNALSTAFAGTLMSDGYAAYRARALRLRCWAHLLRKLRGVAESTDRHAAQPGAQMLELFAELVAAVFRARGHLAQPPPVGNGVAIGAIGPSAAPPCATHAPSVAQLRQLCEQHRHAPHKALREIAREFLNDWDVIMRPLGDPTLPLTNNAAERQLRHYVIARRISYGTRTPVGSHSVALLASVIDTCRLRGASATALLAHAIHAARMGLAAPQLPPIPLTLPSLNTDLMLLR